MLRRFWLISTAGCTQKSQSVTHYCLRCLVKENALPNVNLITLMYSCSLLKTSDRVTSYHYQPHSWCCRSHHRERTRLPADVSSSKSPEDTRYPTQVSNAVFGVTWVPDDKAQLHCAYITYQFYLLQSTTMSTETLVFTKQNSHSISLTHGCRQGVFLMQLNPTLYPKSPLCVHSCIHHHCVPLSQFRS